MTATGTTTPTGTPTGPPTISVSPTSAPPGGLVVVVGSGFAANAGITFVVAGQYAGTYTGGTVVSDGLGTFNAVIVVPATAAAGYTTIGASDALGQIAQISFVVTTAGTPTGTVVPGSLLTVAPTSGVPGATVALSAPAGAFPAGSVATASFQDANPANAATVLGTGFVNTDGSFSLTATLPAQASAGNGTILVTAGGTAQSAPFAIQPALTVSPSSALPGTTIQITGNGFAANSNMSFQIGGQGAAIADSAPVVSTAVGSFTATIVVPAGVAAGQVAVTATDGTDTATGTLLVLTTGTASATPATGSSDTPTLLPTAPPLARSPSATPAALAGTAPVAEQPTTTTYATTTTYFAEGYTGDASANGKASFSEVLNLLNPDANSATVGITYYIQGSSTALVIQRVIASSSVVREQVNADVGPNKLVAALVSAPSDVVVTRTLQRTDANGGLLDGSTSEGVRTPSTEWDFAEGFTGSTFQEYLSILNPSKAQARVTVRLAPQARTAAGARARTVVVPALSRTTVDIRSLNAGSSATSVGMIVTSDRPIIAERVEYFGAGSGSGKAGSTVTAGVTAPATQGDMAFGRSGGSVAGSAGVREAVGDQAYISLLNPSLTGGAIQVTATFKDSRGQRIGRTTVGVPAGTRQTIDANTVLGATAGPFSVTLNANGRIAAEETQYFGGSPNSGAHAGVVVPMATGGSANLSLPDLDTRLVDGTAIERQVFLYNPSSAQIQVTGTYFGGAGQIGQVRYTVPAGGITTVNVNHDAAAGAVGAEYTVTGGSLIAYAVGRTADNRFAIEDAGVPPS